MNTSRFGKILAVAFCLVWAVAAPATSRAGAPAPVHDGMLAIGDFMTGEVYVLNPDGTHFAQVTHGAPAGQSFSPSWAPDGIHLVFSFFKNNVTEIYVMASDGTGRHRVRNEPARFNDDTAQYFPSGTRLVFGRCRADGSGCRIATMRLDGTGLRYLTPPHHEVYDVTPTVSPDGRHIAFTRFNWHGVQAQIWVMNRNGTRAHPVTPTAAMAFEPAWSPDSTHLMYTSNCCRLGGNLTIVRRDGSHARTITHTPYPLTSENGVFAPTGGRVAFVSNRRHPDRCCLDLFTESLGTHHVHRVPLSLTHVGSVAWGRRPA